MDAHRFDHLSKAFIRVIGRRSLTRALVGLPLVGTSGLLAEDTAARRKRRAHAEQKKKKCNGATRRCTVMRGKKKKTICVNTRTDNSHCGGCGIACGTGRPCSNGLCGGGACTPEAEDVTCANICGQVLNNCQQTVNCGDCDCTPEAEDVTCAGQCGQVLNNCGTPVQCPSWINQSTFGSFGTADDQFQNPWDVAISNDGLTALIADPANHRISVWTRSNGDTDWVPQTTFGNSGPAVNQLTSPHGVAISPDGLTALITLDLGGISVWRRSALGGIDWAPQTHFGSAGEGNDQFLTPVGVAISADGLTTWIADPSNHRVSVWRRSTPSSTDWAYQTTFGGWDSGDDRLRFPFDVAVSTDGLTALVTNDNRLVSVWRRTTASSTDWTPQTRFGSGDTGDNQSQFLAWVAISADGLTAWIADYESCDVSVWRRTTPSGTDWAYQTTFGGFGTGSNQLKRPAGVAVSADGLTVWVADYDNNRISVWAQICPA